MSDQNSGNGGGNFWGGLIAGGAGVGIVSLLCNSAKDKRHQEELLLVYQQGCADTVAQWRPLVAAKDMENLHLRNQKQQLEAERAEDQNEIRRLHAVIENLAKTVKLQQVQNTTPILSSGSGENGEMN